MSKCLYNGVELPVLPDWDKTIHPYALIAYRSEWDRYFVLLGSNKSNVLKYGTIAATYTYGVANGGEEWDEGLGALASANVIWANYDVYYADTVEEVGGTLYLAASDPIPVSAPQIDPLSLFMGWKAGNWVARQRGKA